MSFTQIALFAFLVFAAPAVAQTPPPELDGAMSPAEAVAAAAKYGPMGKQGSFAMLVRATGISHGHFFLNSESDYRDPKNLSIDIDPRAAKLLTRQLGSSPDQFYKGKWIIVRGTVHRVPIIFTDNYGRPLGKLYYQTHVPVRLPSQIRLVPASG
jgi:hypothetical protein